MNASDYEKKLKECVRYFKSKRGYDRIFSQIKHNYLSLGRIGGTIRLSDLDEDERYCLSKILNKNYYDKKSANFNVIAIKKSLDQRTVFKGLELKDILFEYYEKELLSSKEKLEIYLFERAKYFSDITKIYKDTPSFNWIEEAFNDKSSLYKQLVQRYDIDKKLLKFDLRVAMDAYNMLVKYKEENKKERLPIFAVKITKNPHAFDEKEPLNALITDAVCHILGKGKPASAEEKLLLFYEGGLIKDEISNFTTFAGFVGFKNDSRHQVWEGFRLNKEPFNANILNLNNIDRVLSPNSKVYVFENPAVFSEVTERFKSEEVALMCTYGQIRFASLLLMDMLIKSGTTLYYNGDFDPEGLQIADKLKKRYESNVILWKYNRKIYLKAISNEYLNSNRLNKLRSIKSAELQEVVCCLKELKRIGYQELIVEDLIADIKNNY